MLFFRIFDIKFSIFLLILSGLLTRANTSVLKTANEKVLMPEKTEQSITIDGLLNEAIWQTEPLQHIFVTYNPTRGDTLPHNTKIWFTYNDQNIYFAFKCLDSEPQGIKTSITQRDKMFADDWIGFSLDAMGSKQSAYDLFINPNGIQGDILNTGNNEDTAPDFVWESAGQMLPDGYQVEVAVPLRSIRFKAGEEVKMGVLFWRKISRLGLSGSWPEIKPGTGLFNVYATLVYQNLKSPVTLEVLPAVTYSRHTERQSPTHWNGTEVEEDIGIGLKYGISSSVTAEFTYNPDFSQVESDAFQVEVNRRYPNFYREKRPFFMEGLDVLNFTVIPHGYMETAVHTRRIVAPRWGTKLTGALGHNSFGILAASDEFPGYEAEDEDEPNLHTGKEAKILIARAKRSLQGDNFIGAIYGGQTFASGYNHVVGTDAQYRLFKNQQTCFSIMQSFNRNPEGENYTSGNSVNFTHSYTTRKLQMMGTFQHIDPGFNMESSFMTRSGINDGWIFIGPYFYPNWKNNDWFKVFSPQIIIAFMHDIVDDIFDTFFCVPFEFGFSRQGRFTTEFIQEQETWEGTAFQKKQMNLMGQVQLTKWLGLEGVCTLGEQIYYDGDPAYLGWMNLFNFEVSLQPNTKFIQDFQFYHENFVKRSNQNRIYEVNLINSRTTYQFNKYLFLRSTLRYNSYDKHLLTDFLLSFTWIPGTVVHLGYGMIYEKNAWQENRWVEKAGKMYEMQRGLFFKASYLWRY